MHQRSFVWLAVVVAMLGLFQVAQAQVAGQPGDNLVVAQNGQTQARVLVSPQAPEDSAQRLAADDLAKYIGLMSGTEPQVVSEQGAINQALNGDGPVFVVGELALQTEPSLQRALDEVKKPDPLIRADAMIARRDGNRVYLAGTNDESHYHAVAWLLHQWGCRWYLPTEIGEVVPEHDELAVGEVDHVYAPPFEIRGYWISWNGSNEGRREFQLRNFMNGQSHAGMGHALAKFTEAVVPEGKSHFNVPFSEPETAEAVLEAMAGQLEQQPPYGISLAIEDGAYENDSEEDARLQAGIYDKYFLKPNMTDPMMALYENVGNLMAERYPNNPTRIGGMAYVNVTIPPQWKRDIPDNLVMWLAPIDIDPNHGIDDPQSPPRQEYGAMLHRWADLMDGRVAIYDYDQGMLVWRDIPNPSQQAFVQDVKHYRDAGILGISTESRNAIATVFLNLFYRGQLMWDPETDIDALTEEFYPNFYGPAADPMGKFWDAIFQAWEETIVTEHEYHAAPAIYTPELMQELEQHIIQANRDIAPLRNQADRTRQENQYVQRMEMANLQWQVLDGYMDMVFAAATDGDYAQAAELGRKALQDRLELTQMNSTFTTRVNEANSVPGGSAAWFEGEVQQYIDLDNAVNGTNGRLLKQLPVEWAFHRDPHDTGLPRGWAYKDADLTYWNEHKDEYDLDSRKDYPTTEWEMVRTDLYPQAQGVRHPDRQSFTGFLWYKTKVELEANDANQNVHIRFPGLFNEVWLYVNGNLVAHRQQNPMWWYNDYKFEWDVDISEHVQEGENDITIRCNNPHHYGGMFRRPFLYVPNE